MPPDVRDWLAEDHLAWFVIDAVGEMDLDAFYVAYRQDGRSRPAYDPAMMAALLLYAFARETRSSRQIERGCEEDVALRVLASRQSRREAHGRPRARGSAANFRRLTVASDRPAPLAGRDIRCGAITCG